MNEFDDFDDPQLRSTLQRAAGQAPDLPAAFAAVSTCAARIRRRRTVVVAASSLGLVVAAVAIVARPLDHDVKVTPGTDGNHVATTMPVTTVPTTPVPTTASRPSPSAPTATPAVTNPITPGAPGTSVDDHGGAGGSGGSGTSAGTNAAGNQTRTYSSEGGSVTVRLQNGAVRIAAGPSPSRGFQASVSDRGPDRVRVEFVLSVHRSCITVTVQDGLLVARVSESGSGIDDQGGAGGGSGSGSGSGDDGGRGGSGGGGSSSGGSGADGGGGGGSAGGDDHGGDTPGSPGGDDLGSHGGHG